MVRCLLGPHSEKGLPGHHSLSLMGLRAKGCLSGAISLWTPFMTTPTSLHLQLLPQGSPAWQPLLVAKRALNISSWFPLPFVAAKTEGMVTRTDTIPFTGN